MFSAFDPVAVRTKDLISALRAEFYYFSIYAGLADPFSFSPAPLRKSIIFNMVNLERPRIRIIPASSAPKAESPQCLNPNFNPSFFPTHSHDLKVMFTAFFFARSGSVKAFFFICPVILPCLAPYAFTVFLVFYSVSFALLFFPCAPIAAGIRDYFFPIGFSPRQHVCSSFLLVHTNTIPHGGYFA